MFKGKCILSVVALLCPGFVIAQDPSTGRPQATLPGTDHPDRQDPSRSSANNSSAKETDKILAAWVLSANKSEVALGRLAMQRASSNDVRQFAKKMVEEHGALISKLQPLAGTGISDRQSGDRTGGLPGERRGQDRSGERQGERSGERQGERSGERSGERGGERSDERSGERSGDRSGMGTLGDRQEPDAHSRQGTNKEFDHIALIQEIEEKCLESGTKMLSQKSGEEFDNCYMMMQVFSHMKALDMMTVFGNHASPELKKILEGAKSTTKSHLEKAEQLVKENSKIGQNRGPQNPGTPGR